MQNKFYTYVYLDPRKSGCYCYKDVCFLYEPIYVGKGQGKRYLDHLRSLKKKNNRIKQGKRSYFKNKLLKILGELTDYNIENYILIFRDNLTEHQSLNLEKYLIKIIGRADLKKGPLTNLTDGGEGTSGHIQPSRPCTEETKAKISKGNKGKIKTDETKEKLRQANLGKKWSSEMREKMEGRCASEEQKQKTSQALKGKKHTKDHIEKVRLANLGRKCSEESKEKNRLAHLGKKASEETKQKMRNKKHTEEQKRKISESLKGRKYAEQYGEKIRLAKLGTKLSERTKEKIRQAHLGKKISEETRRKMADSRNKFLRAKEEILCI